MNIHEEIMRILNELLDIDMQAEGNLNLITDLGINSYELVQVVCAIEDKFNIEIQDDILLSFKTVNDIVKYIQSRRES